MKVNNCIVKSNADAMVNIIYMFEF